MVAKLRLHLGCKGGRLGPREVTGALRSETFILQSARATEQKGSGMCHIPTAYPEDPREPDQWVTGTSCFPLRIPSGKQRSLEF